MKPDRRNAIHDALIRLADGDRSAFPGLIDDLWPLILAFVKRGVGHQQDAEDVAQEVLVRICSRISDFDRKRDGLSWVFGIAGYEIMTLRRRAKRRRENFGDPAFATLADSAGSQEETAIQQQVTHTMTQALGSLSAEDRLHLGLVDTPFPKELPSATLRKRKQRALNRLRDVWRKLYGEP